MCILMYLLLSKIGYQHKSIDEYATVLIISHQYRLNPCRCYNEFSALAKDTKICIAVYLSAI